MPPKPRRNRGKHPHQSRKSKAIQRQEAFSSRPIESEESAEVVAAVTVPVPQPAEVSSRQRTIGYPYIYKEIRRIGILAAIMIIILIVLSLFIS